LKSYQEIIRDDDFHVDDQHAVETNLYKLCWGCEKKYKAGHMVWDASKFRRIFFCEECFLNLQK
jgi:hypothetical protein